ncbi:transcriptional regulator RcsA [Erwinia psidii]|uniref:Transcriptional regulatory protein RcsA n=1 Tax=Erwinia psidii TaxID=69224 RepID=A0A3N6SHB9_9GAMM|nr:transcriptional regulator RcsA [Erwinia psidii]MCX8956324.1 transcriptional regulator RcsA [Erwinia psidii]MCX8959916.1 transcriptional regulator RcsA [Erwinia psidii]MCX8963462.1 transcriptional regulator RcsA [Erwinia psidii]RQM39323.1 transcriptional regulator RcsA [Erwinia psidii]
MPTIIMDTCSYTRLGLTDYLAVKGIKKKSIISVTDIDQLQTRCQQIQPGVVFINENCFIHEADASQRIRSIIMHNPDTLFFIFMAISNIHFEEYLYVRKNLIITSKSIKPATLDNLLHSYFQKRINASTRYSSGLDVHPLTLSQTESNMLKMWMSGHDTIQISDKMKIKAKTVSSHKGNIKRKIKTHNKQVIYHVVRLTDNVTSGIYVNVR